MQNLNTIPVAGKFFDVASKANTNFLAIKTAIEQLELSVTRSKGFFSSATALTNKYPSPVVGDWAVVQDTSVSPPATYIWQCTTNGTWSNSGTEWPGGSVDLSEYLQKEDFYDIEEREITTDITSQFSFTDNKGVLSSNGKLSSNTTYDPSYAHSNFVNIEGATKIKIRLPRKPQKSSSIGVAFYTSNGGYLTANFISGDKSDSSGSPSALLTQVKELTVPNGAKYVATSWYSSSIISQYGPISSPFLCEITFTQSVEVDKYARAADLNTERERIDDIKELEEEFSEWKDDTDELLNGSENYITFITNATINGKKITSSSYSSGYGYLANSANASIYIYDLAQYTGKHIYMKYSYVSNAFKYLILSNYTILQSLTSDNQEDLAQYVLSNGGKGYPAAKATATLLVPDAPCYLVLNPYVSQYGMPEISIVEDSVEGLVSRVDAIEDSIGGLNGIRQEMREGYVNMNYTSINSVNDVWLKYSSQAPIGPKFGMKMVLPLGSNSIQSSALYNNILVVLTTTGTTYIIDAETMIVLRSGTLIANDGSHHNSAAFCGEFYDADDDLPILMVMGNQESGDNNAEVLLFRVAESNGIYDITRIGTMYLPLHDETFKNNAGACNVHFWDGKLLVEYRYANGSSNTIRLATFTMPTIGNNTEVYVPISSLVDDWEVSTSTTMQDSSIDGNTMYIGRAYGMTYYDLLNKQAISTITPKDINSYFGEMESNFVYNNRLYMIGYNSSRTVRGIWLLDVRTI